MSPKKRLFVVKLGTCLTNDMLLCVRCSVRQVKIWLATYLDRLEHNL